MKTIEKQSCLKFMKRGKSPNYLLFTEGPPSCEIGYNIGVHNLELGEHITYLNWKWKVIFIWHFRGK